MELEQNIAAKLVLSNILYQSIVELYIYFSSELTRAEEREKWVHIRANCRCER